MHYVDRRSDSDADAPVLAPPDYLVSSVTVPPSTVGVHPAFRPHPDKGLSALAVDQSAHADPTLRTHCTICRPLAGSGVRATALGMATSHGWYGNRTAIQEVSQH